MSNCNLFYFLQVTKVNDLTVASIETYAPLSRISLVVRAGSRYEPVDQLGLTHFVRLAAAQVSYCVILGERLWVPRGRCY